jgi:hypothetical protein
VSYSPIAPNAAAARLTRWQPQTLIYSRSTAGIANRLSAPATAADLPVGTVLTRPTKLPEQVARRRAGHAAQGHRCATELGFDRRRRCRRNGESSSANCSVLNGPDFDSDVASCRLNKTTGAECQKVRTNLATRIANSASHPVATIRNVKPRRRRPCETPCLPPCSNRN